MTIQELLTACRVADIVLATDGDTLDVDAPRGALTPELREALVRRKPELLPVLWRLAEMRRIGVDPMGRGGRPPVAVAVVDASGGPGFCFSCGARLDHARGYGRCMSCDFAADLYYAAQNEVEGVEVVA